jgi:hypothetical protein
MAIENQSKLFNSELFSLSTARNMGNSKPDQNLDCLINMFGLHHEFTSTTLKILESNDIIDDVRNLDTQFEFIPTLYGIKEPRNWEIKYHPSTLLSTVPAHELPNLDIQQFGMQNSDICAMFGSAGTYWLSLNSQNSDSLTLQLHPYPTSTSSPIILPSPSSIPLLFPPIQSAIAETGWEEPFSRSGSPVLQYPDDAKPQGGNLMGEVSFLLLLIFHNGSLKYCTTC